MSFSLSLSLFFFRSDMSFRISYVRGISFGLFSLVIYGSRGLTLHELRVRLNRMSMSSLKRRGSLRTECGWVTDEASEMELWTKSLKWTLSIHCAKKRNNTTRLLIHSRDDRSFVT